MSKKTIYNLSFNQTLAYTIDGLQYIWLRVPGGWNLTVVNEKGLSNTFIPQSNEFRETLRELENKATDVVGKRILRSKKQK
ncbi:MAG: hypothetical protein J6Y25_03730 [Elusimicrobiaceae bacterium]|nr:hypothetical protein [Elusimicrobiaceae bacterium]MBP5616968.1 hypothetical protein [Elusimicrobiaceae bacterium]